MYDTWAEAEAQVKDIPGNMHKKFRFYADAKAYVDLNYQVLHPRPPYRLVRRPLHTTDVSPAPPPTPTATYTNTTPTSTLSTPSHVPTTPRDDGSVRCPLTRRLFKFLRYALDKTNSWCVADWNDRNQTDAQHADYISKVFNPADWASWSRNLPSWKFTCILHDLETNDCFSFVLRIPNLQ